MHNQSIAMWISIMLIIVIGLVVVNTSKYVRQRDDLRRMQYLNDALKEIEKHERKPNLVIEGPYIDL